MQVRLCATLGLMVAGALGCAQDQQQVASDQSEIHGGLWCSRHEVAMCHHDRHDGEDHTICVPPFYVFWHLREGDTIGRCEEPPDCPPAVECGPGTVLQNGECVPA